MKKGKSVGEIVAQGHYDAGYEAGEAAGKDALITEIFKAAAEWEKHQGRCYCSACDVLKPVFRTWERITAEATAEFEVSVSRETETQEPAKRRRGRPAAR